MKVSLWQDMLHKELEIINEHIDGFSKELLQSNKRPEPVADPGRLKKVSRPQLQSSAPEKLENDILQVDKSDNSMSYLERYFAQAKNDKAVQWMKERYDKVKKYYNPFENAQSVNVAVFMGLILPEAETGFREGL